MAGKQCEWVPRLVVVINQEAECYVIARRVFYACDYPFLTELD